MENYIVSARKYRPSTFATVVGQKALTATLKNAVATGRLAHSYLFCGPRGVGKTSCARIFAKTINCTNRTADGEACNECASCRDFNTGVSMNIIELDAASNNSVDDIRALTDQVMMPPAAGRYRVFIVDEVHMLSAAAFNAFLKTLEEPPGYVVFILATTEKHKIIPTILSRCQIYDFHRITIQDMIEHMQYVASCEGIIAEDSALNVIARKADGAMRDALSIFDQVAASSRGNITYQNTIDNLNVLDTDIYTRLTECMLAGDIMQSWIIYKEIREKGFDSQFFVNGLAQYLRDLMVSRDPSTITLVDAGDEARAAMARTAAKCSPTWLYQALCLCNDADLNYRASSGKQLLVEITLAKICQLSGNATAPSHAAPALRLTVQATPAATPPPAQPAATTARPVQPVTSVPVPPPPPRPATPERTGSRPTISININAKPRSRQDNTEAIPTGDVATEDQPDVPPAPVRPEALLEAWDKFIADNPREHMLVNAMRLSKPVPAQNRPGVFIVNLPNKSLMQTVGDAMPKIRTYMASQLNGQMPQFELAVTVTDAPHTRNEREIVAHLYRNEPMVKKYIDTLGLKLD